MPFRKGTTPRRLKGKGIPQKFMDQFIGVFNSVYKKTKSDKQAYTQAYGVMNKALYKAGYRKDKDGKWKKVESVEAIPVYEAMLGGEIVLEEETTLEKSLREGLRFEGIAFIDNAVSQLGTGYERYYSPEFNDLCLKRTKSSMELGGTVTMYNKHGSALGSLFGAGASKNPIGRIEDLWREESEIRYRAFISPTQEGKDTIRLILDKVMGQTSVRMVEVSSVMFDLEQDDDQGGENYGVIEVMNAARVAGIDLCDQAGITGARIVKVLESFNVPEYENIEGGNDVDEKAWEELTLEELLENRKDLVDAHVASMLEALTDKNTELQEALDTALAVPGEQTERVKELELDLAIEQAAQIGVGKNIAKALREEVKTVEEIPGALGAIREQALRVVLASQPVGKTTVKGEADPQELEDEEDDAEEAAEAQLSEPYENALRLAS